MGGDKPLLSQIAELISALSSLMWPVLILLVMWLAREKLLGFLTAAVDRISKASEIVIGPMQIKGVIVDSSGEIRNKFGQVIRPSDASVKLIPASKGDVDRRHQIHSDQRGFMLVHTISPSEPPEFQGQLRIFNVSVFLHSHRGNGNIGEVESVSYYFGDKWGRSRYGSKFVVENPAESFALTARMFGACLCLADVKFKDGQSIELRRYMDVEMAPVYGVSLEEARISK